MKTETKYFFMKVIAGCLILGLLVFLMVFFVKGVRAEDNKTVEDPIQFTNRGFPKILDADKWTSQLVYDTISACYQGTIRWVLLSNPSLFGQLPNPIAQRQMVEHCFCVMDKIRKENKIEEYRKKVIDPQWGGNLFMLKATECVKKYKTLPSFFVSMPTPDNKTKSNNTTIIPEEPQDSKEESPDQQQKESTGFPETIFQG